MIMLSECICNCIGQLRHVASLWHVSFLLCCAWSMCRILQVDMRKSPFVACSVTDGLIHRKDHHFREPMARGSAGQRWAELGSAGRLRRDVSAAVMLSEKSFASAPFQDLQAEARGCVAQRKKTRRGAPSPRLG